ncbi:transcriptional regulator [Kitasatospora phosalacinea]|uniref:Transcriptional regulator n=1 Tax=Kitasatospora phosalacinea TaxID=2065 RepID=A0A9W6QF88_9ACTN|nr:helix-turn-helix transcriptional regulator [Kitasatospora phosalacinea]GLW74486.1 transcriptional regulator [Kitasatospora phosalacinea]
MSLSNPLDSRMHLGAELRRLRKKRGMTMRQVADFLDCSETRISRLETGKLTGAVLKPGELRRLAELFGVNDQGDVDQLLHLLGETEQTAWWEPYEDVLPSGMDALLGLQTSATDELALELVRIHPLLQTDAYFRALLAEGRTHSPYAIDRLADLRARRAEVLHRGEGPLRLFLLLDEAALRRPVGSAEVMREQLEWLVRAERELTNVRVRIVPFGIGAHAGMSGAFSLFKFTDQPTVVHVDSPAGPLLLNRDRDVQDLTQVFDHVFIRALSARGSLDLITQIIEDCYT